MRSVHVTGLDIMGKSAAGANGSLGQEFAFSIIEVDGNGHVLDGTGSYVIPTVAVGVEGTNASRKVSGLETELIRKDTCAIVDVQVDFAIELRNGRDVHVSVLVEVTNGEVPVLIS